MNQICEFALALLGLEERSTKHYHTCCMSSEHPERGGVHRLCQCGEPQSWDGICIAFMIEQTRWEDDVFRAWTTAISCVLLLRGWQGSSSDRQVCEVAVERFAKLGAWILTCRCLLQTKVPTENKQRTANKEDRCYRVLSFS